MVIHTALLCLLIGMSGCAMFRSDPDPTQPASPAPPAVAAVATETTNEPVPVDNAVAEAQPANEEAEVVEPLCFETVGIAFLEPPQSTPEGKAAGSREVIEAKGYGFPSAGATNAVQKRATASEAAQCRAMANLAEKHLGVRVTRQATTLNMAFDREEVVVNLSGTLKGISEVDRSYNEESEMATVSLKMTIETEQKPVRREQQPTIEQRKARAEVAARIHAMALLREKIGQAYIEQEIRVEGLEMSHQEALIHVEGLLEGVRFSEIRWTSESICEVIATLELSPDKLGADKASAPSADTETGS